MGITLAVNSLHAGWILLVIGLYFVMLLLVGWRTGRKSNNETFFVANRNMPWYVVTFGMIGTSISGITFISIPGQVNSIGFAYFQVVLGYMVGYAVIIWMLLPLYYRMGHISIYGYLRDRFGRNSYKVGASFFLVSRTVGSAVRLLLAVRVLQLFIFDRLGVPFELSLFICMGLIIAYSYRGGVKTVIWTDNLQTTFLIGALILTVVVLVQGMDTSLASITQSITESKYGRIFFMDDPNSRSFFWKQFLGGAFITIAMTGLDQDLMQKNLSCRTLKHAQVNVASYSLILLVVNALFLLLGALMYMYFTEHNITAPAKGDQSFPLLALNYLPISVGLLFLLGLTAATFASTDSALAALVTSFCIDFLGFEKEGNNSSVARRVHVHLAFGAVIVLVAILVHYLDNGSLIDLVMKYAGYTYGPLLGLFTLGIATRRVFRERWVPLVCVLTPIAMVFVERGVKHQFPNYQFGYEMIIWNGILSILFLLAISRSKPIAPQTTTSSPVLPGNKG